MTFSVIKFSTDLDNYPTAKDNFAASTQPFIFVFGDAHANSKKIIHDLIEAGFIKMSPQDYADLVLLLNKDYELFQLQSIMAQQFGSIDEFIAFIKQLSMNSSIKDFFTEVEYAVFEKKTSLIFNHPSGFDKNELIPHLKLLAELFEGLQVKIHDYLKNNRDDYNSKLATNFTRYLNLLKKISVVNTKDYALFLGDLINDRFGPTNNHVIALLKTLSDQGLKLPDFPISNHDIEAFRETEFFVGDEIIADECIPTTVTTAYMVFNKLFDVGQYSKDLNWFLNKQKLFNYNYDKETNEFTLFMHGPRGFQVIQMAARFFGLPLPLFKEGDNICINSVDSFLETLNNINLKFQEIKDRKALYELFTTSMIVKDSKANLPANEFNDYLFNPQNDGTIKDSNKFDCCMAFLSEAAWQRVSENPGKDYDTVYDMPIQLIDKSKHEREKSYVIKTRFVHGHDLVEKRYEHIVCLDNRIGHTVGYSKPSGSLVCVLPAKFMLDLKESLAINTANIPPAATTITMQTLSSSESVLFPSVSQVAKKQKIQNEIVEVLNDSNKTKK